ncbi:hypothetical protein V6N12_070485 [Hibiscus sabdariffa]|uniref:Uncharacterized protein n=1 Tax=Hibiscus sabdariffa TaxID=183260 RepID=A0ABR2FH70_9ROSI
MDREHEEMQFLGLFGIFKESYKLIFSCKKIFTNITLALILPLSFIYLVHVQVSSVFSRNIIHKKYEKLSDLILHEWIYLWFFNAAYFFVFFIFSLPSTAAVVYTIASIYTARELKFNKIMNVVPTSQDLEEPSFIGDEVLVILVILIIVGFSYLTTIWHFAGVVTVFEETIGFPAMVKSKNLINGKVWLAVPIFVILNLAMWLHHIAFQRLVVEGTTMQTVVYFVCKSYHHENVDKSVLSDRLNAYLLGGYSLLKANNVQLFHVILVRM